MVPCVFFLTSWAAHSLRKSSLFMESSPISDPSTASSECRSAPSRNCPTTSYALDSQSVNSLRDAGSRKVILAQFRSCGARAVQSPKRAEAVWFHASTSERRPHTYAGMPSIAVSSACTAGRTAGGAARAAAGAARAGPGVAGGVRPRSWIWQGQARSASQVLQPLGFRAVVRPDDSVLGGVAQSFTRARAECRKRTPLDVPGRGVPCRDQVRRRFRVRWADRVRSDLWGC